MDVSKTTPVTGFAVLGIMAIRGTIMSDGSFRSGGQSYALDSNARLITGDGVMRLMSDVDSKLTVTGGAVSSARLAQAVAAAQKLGGRIAGLTMLLPVDQFIRKSAWGLKDAQATTLIAKVETYANITYAVAA